MKDGESQVEGGPRDYSEDVYRFELQVGEISETVNRVVGDFIGAENIVFVDEDNYCYEILMPIQAAPDLVNLLVGANVAIYQVTRKEKTAHRWR